MAYQVIARKYRPQRFEDVVGQDHVTQTLRNAILQNRIAHAYLFVGPRGTGKTTIARIFAKCLNCTDGPKVDYADDDPRCVEISEGRSLDVLEIDGASNRGIDEIRALRDTAVYAPVNSRFKIYIIDEVHMLTREAFNALLKTLEEPPPHVKFMFATTEPEKVLPTILSRCQRFDLKRIPVPLIVKQLAFICKNEGVDADELALEAIARGAEGCLRDAESTLDQLISFCGNKVQESDVLTAFGLASHGEIQKLAGAILDADLHLALKTLHFLLDNGKDISRLNSDLLTHFRNLTLFLISKGDRSLMEVSDAEWGCIQTQAAKMTLEELSRIMEIFVGNEWKLSNASSRSVVMELSLVEAVQARHAVSIDTLIQKLTALRKGGAAATVTAAPQYVAPKPATPPPTIPASPAPARSFVPPTAASVSRRQTPPATPQPYAALAAKKVAAQQTVPSDAKAFPTDLKEFWKGTLEYLKKKELFLFQMVEDCILVSFKNNCFEIGIPIAEGTKRMLLEDPKQKKCFEDYLLSCGYPNCRVVFCLSEAAKPSPMEEEKTPVEKKSSPEQPVTPSAAPTEAVTEAPLTKLTEVPEAPPVEPIDFKNDPLIKQALDLFQASIVQTGLEKKN